MLDVLRSYLQCTADMHPEHRQLIQDVWDTAVDAVEDQGCEHHETELAISYVANKINILENNS